MDINGSMFREYDIRGLFRPGELDEGACYLIGRAFGTWLRRKGIAKATSGWDYRSYSERLNTAAVMGLVNSGIDVTSIGCVITPCLYWSGFHLNVKGGLMTTASHNPNGWSGTKLVDSPPISLLGDEIRELRRMIEEDDFVTGWGSVSHAEIKEDYLRDIVNRVNISRSLKVAVDCGNGTASIFAPRLLKMLGMETKELFCDLDWTFPHHNPNPSDLDGLVPLIDTVRSGGFDLGLAFDGDGDRCGVIDEQGNVIYADKLLILLARLALAKNPGGSVVYDVKCSMAVPEDVKAHGGVPVMWKTGHSYIKRKAEEIGAVMAGERSGHLFPREGWYGFDDAMMASAMLLEYIAAQEAPVSEIVGSLPSYFVSPETKALCPDEHKYRIVEELQRELLNEFGDKVTTINGARVDFGDGWGLVRASSNMPELGLVFEGRTRERMLEIRRIFREKLAQHPEIDMNWHNDVEGV